MGAELHLRLGAIGGIKMQERVRKVLEILAILTTISGVTLNSFRESNSIAFYSSIVLLLLLAGIAFISWREDNVFKVKAEIDNTWNRLMLGASRSIKVFAGDVSWIARDEKLLIQRIEEGIVVSVLCRRPHNNKTTDNVRRLLESGAQVKYYDHENPVLVRGLLIDDEEVDRTTALTVRKVPKRTVFTPEDSNDGYPTFTGTGLPGNSSIYDYEARRYLPTRDIQHLQALSNLFGAIWKNGDTGVVLQTIKPPVELIVQYLQTVPHYQQLTANEVRFQVVDIQSLWSTSLFVKDYKFNNIRSIIEAYDRQGLQVFSPCLCISHIRRSILMPPILEEHAGRLVVVDGMHRLFYRLVIMQKPDALCMVVSTRTDLPSTPIPFTRVQMWPHKLPRDQAFDNYRPELFRNIDLLENVLGDSYQDLMTK